MLDLQIKRQINRSKLKSTSQKLDQNIQNDHNCNQHKYIKKQINKDQQINTTVNSFDQQISRSKIE